MPKMLSCLTCCMGRGKVHFIKNTMEVGKDSFIRLYLGKRIELYWYIALRVCAVLSKGERAGFSKGRLRGVAVLVRSGQY